VTRAPDYDQAATVRALREVGLHDGEVVFAHAGVALLGVPAEGLDEATIGAAFLGAFREVLGTAGTLVLPAFTYSYTKGEVFDPAATPPTAAMGTLSSALWRHPDAARSLDPIFSVVAIGGGARELAASVVPGDCFGAGSIFARLLERDAALLTIGVGGGALTFIHHVEQSAAVPYRFLKRFRGTTVVDGVARETEVLYNVRDLDDAHHAPYVDRVHADARAQGILRVAPLGRGEVAMLRAREAERLVLEGLARDPDYLVRGSGGGA
jgi:aminoglycoside 3-N-acetyltransferase